MTLKQAFISTAGAVGLSHPTPASKRRAQKTREEIGMTAGNGRFRETARPGILGRTGSAVKAGLLAAALLPVVAATAARADTIVQYSFSPDAAFVLSGDSQGPFGSNVTETITGGFLWDLTTSSLVSATLTVSGSYLTETWTTPPQATASSAKAWYINDGIGGFVQVVFAHNLNGLADALVKSNGYVSSLNISNTNQGTIATVTGSAVPGAIPEPATMSVMGVALAGLGMIRRRRAMRRPT